MKESCRRVLASVFAFAAISQTTSGCVAVGEANVDAKGKPGFDFTGTVIDKSTMKPIEGAYVVAIYHADAGPPPAYKTWCVKTRGTYSDSEGKFSFPITRLDGRSPMMASAIKRGYYRAGFDVPSREVWQRQDATTYANRNVYLMPQDASKPSYEMGSGEEYCPQAPTSADADAGLRFLRMELDELKRIGAPKSIVDAAEHFVKSRELRSGT